MQVNSGELCFQRIFSNLAREVGLVEKTVREVFDDNLHRISEGMEAATPKYLGIDEVYIGQVFCLVVTNIKEKTTCDMYPDNAADTVAGAIRAFPDYRSSIKAVRIDMQNDYRRIIQKTLGREIPIVADKFHVLAMVNKAADNFRRAMGAAPIKLKRQKDEEDEDNLKRRVVPRNLIKSPAQSLSCDEREELGKMLDSFTKMRAAHKAKEEFFQIYDLSRRRQADERLRE